MKLLHSTACDSMVYKDYKNWSKTYPFSMLNRLQDPTPHLFSYAPPMRVFLLYLLSTFDHAHTDQWLAAFEVHLDTSCRGGWVSELKIISLYLVMVSLMPSSSSSLVFIQFRRGIFNFFCKF